MTRLPWPRSLLLALALFLLTPRTPRVEQLAICHAVW
jgi:hypothetical protein